MGTIIGELIGIVVEFAVHIVVQTFYRIALMLRFDIESKMTKKALPNAGYVDCSKDLNAALSFLKEAGQALDRKKFAEARALLIESSDILQLVLSHNASHFVTNSIVRFGEVRKGTRNVVVKGAVVKGWEERGRFKLARKLGGLAYIVEQELKEALAFLPPDSELDVTFQDLQKNLASLDAALLADDPEASQLAYDAIKVADRKLARWVIKYTGKEDINLLSIAMPVFWMEKLKSLQASCQASITRIDEKHYQAAYDAAVELYTGLEKLMQDIPEPHWAATSHLLSPYAGVLEETKSLAITDNTDWSYEQRIRLAELSGKLGYISQQIIARSSRELKQLQQFSDRSSLLNYASERFLDNVEKQQISKAEEEMADMSNYLVGLKEAIDMVKG